MEARLLRAALSRKRAMVALAVLAVAIGSSVACCLLHVSHDISRKLTRELRALGPNLLLLPPEGLEPAWIAEGVARPGQAGVSGFLDEDRARARLRSASLEGAGLLLVSARAGAQPVQVVGADLESALRLHPAWSLGPGERSSLIGVRLARRLGLTTGDTLRVAFGSPGADPLTSESPRRLERPVGAVLESGGPDDEAWWVPLADAQQLSGLAGRLSLVQARIEDPGRARALQAALERGGGLRAVPLHALSATEAALLDRMRSLMAYVTVGVLLAAALCAFGTLTDLALERRREIALMKALGAGRQDVARQLGAESFAVGLLGGLVGWWWGFVMAQVVGRQVFDSSIAARWEVLPVVLLISIAVAAAAGAGPIRLALAVDPAPALRGE